MNNHTARYTLLATALMLSTVVVAIDSRAAASRYQPDTDRFAWPSAAMGYSGHGNQAAAPTEEISDPQLDPLTLWQAARRAAWESDLKRSSTLYWQLIGLQPENPDAYGELGNVFVQQGDWEAAVDVYYQAAELLADRGEMMMAWRLQRIIRGFDHHRAEALHEHLMRRR